MKLSFDLFNGESCPSRDAIQWLPRWWYISSNLNIVKGKLSGGHEWLLVGQFCDSRPASEIIFNYIKTKSPEILFKADGQFLLFVHFPEDDSVFLGRDRFGILPVVFAKGEKGLVFSLWFDNALQLSGLKRRVDPFLLKQWPVYRKTFAPYTPFSSIESLSSSQFLFIKDSNVSKINIPLGKPTGEKFYNLKSAAASLGRVLEESVYRRIDSTQRMGVLLSGGNDSSLVVALIRKKFSGNLQTLFVNFTDNPRDYQAYAQYVADKFSTNHHSICLTPRDYVSSWAETIKILQTPIPMPCHIGFAKAMQVLTDKVDLLIDGDGADTVFGAGLWPQMISLARAGDFLPYNLRRFFLKIAQKISGDNLVNRIASMPFEALGTPINIYPHANAAIAGKREIDVVFGEGTWDSGVKLRSSLTSGEFYESFFSYLMLHGLPMDIATAVRLGINSRLIFTYPFLDYALVLESMKLSNSLRYHYRTRKAVLKEYSLNYFDKEFIYKPKEGFGVPLGKWFSSKEFGPFLKLPLEERSLKRGWWNKDRLEKIISDHAAGLGSDGSAEAIPWIAVNLELWARICIEGDSPDNYKI